MKKKLFMLLAGSVLSAVLLAGCNNDDRNPPAPTNNNINTPTDNRMDNDLTPNDTNDVIDDNIMDRNHYPETEDKNTPHDKDPGKDNNTPQEDIIEDDIDVNDRDNKDE
ncbi:MAG: hypothetical protein ABGX20_06885 [Bacillus sp. (in: firmicutes)]